MFHLKQTRVKQHAIRCIENQTKLIPIIYLSIQTM